MLAVLREDSRRGRCATAGLIYCAVTAVFFLVADWNRLVEHTPYNHFALLAESWISGVLDLPGGPPAYAGNNDFSRFEDRWFITFPAFPAVLLLPLVALSGEASRVRDGQFFVWCAAVAPAVLFLALERMRALGLSSRTRVTNCALSFLFAFGTVYFFSAVQGTVWFAAHVIGAALIAAYLLFSLGAERPLLAGLVLGLAFHTRAPLLFAAPLFLLEALRVSVRAAAHSGESFFSRVDFSGLARRVAMFSAPIFLCLLVACAHNMARFGDPTEFGYRYLQIAWRPRIDRWGLFHYHYLARNLAVIGASLPWLGGKTLFQINLHGLALWFTTPLYVWLLWPRVRGTLHRNLWITVAAVALPTLLYQNTGWAQFGYRFSNDYAALLFGLLALGGQRLSRAFVLASIWAVAVNLFGALTFERGWARGFYVHEPTQKVLFQPD